MDGVKCHVQLSGAIVVKRTRMAPLAVEWAPEIQLQRRLRHSPSGRRKGNRVVCMVESAPSPDSPKDKVLVRCVERALATFPTSVCCCTKHYSNHQRTSESSIVHRQSRALLHVPNLF